MGASSDRLLLAFLFLWYLTSFSFIFCGSFFVFSLFYVSIISRNSLDLSAISSLPLSRIILSSSLSLGSSPDQRSLFSSISGSSLSLAFVSSLSLFSLSLLSLALSLSLLYVSLSSLSRRDWACRVCCHGNWEKKGPRAWSKQHSVICEEPFSEKENVVVSLGWCSKL